MNEKLTLRALRSYHKFRRRVRSWNEIISYKTFPISDEYSRAHLSLKHLKGQAIQPLQYPAVQADEAPIFYSTFCGPLSRMTFRPQPMRPGAIYYFVSNNMKVLRIVKKFGWKPIFLDVPISINPIESAHQAKIAKAVPHIFPDLRQHRFLTYIDDKQAIDLARLERDFESLVEAGAALAVPLWSHISENILLEYTTGMRNERYRKQSQHMARYVMQKLASGGRLEQSRLFCTQYILRDMHHQAHNEISEKWYLDIQKCGVLCQLSFDFVAQDNPAVLDLEPLKQKPSFLDPMP